MSKLTLNNKNNHVEGTFQGKFYILKQGNLYNLILTDSHFSMASNISLDGLIVNLENILNRYKTYSNLEKSLRNMEYPVKVPTATYDSRVLLYKEQGDTYNYLIDGMIALHENKEKKDQKEKNKVKPLKIKKKIIVKKA